MYIMKDYTNLIMVYSLQIANLFNGVNVEILWRIF